MGPSNGMSEMVSAADAPLMPSDIRIILGVGGEDEGDDLSLAAEAIREHGAYGAVNLATGEDFTLAGTAFALDEAAGDASAGVGVFAIINGQREEIDALAGIRVGGGGGENDIIANAHNDRTVRLLG